MTLVDVLERSKSIVGRGSNFVRVKEERLNEFFKEPVLR